MKDFRTEEVKFKNQISEIIKNNFVLFPIEITNIDLSSDEEDTKESFDLIYKSQILISVRIRKYKYLNYCDFTIRNKSMFNGITEIDKLIEGKGSVYLYAWKDKLEEKLISWILVDINKIRHKLKDEGIQRYNIDNTAFKAYSIDWLNKNSALINFENLPEISF